MAFVDLGTPEAVLLLLALLAISALAFYGAVRSWSSSPSDWRDLIAALTGSTKHWPVYSWIWRDLERHPVRYLWQARILSLLGTGFSFAFALLVLLHLLANPTSPLVEFGIDGATLHFQTERGLRVSIDVVQQCGPPAVGSHEIRAVQVRERALTATYGKHSAATVAFDTGEVECTAD